MDSAAATPAQQPPAQGLQRARRVCFCSIALNLVLFLAVTASFGGAAYRARHRPRDLAFVAAAYYLLLLLLCCVAKLEQLRADTAAAQAQHQQRRRAMLAAWAVSAALSVMFASRVAGAMPMMTLKLAVWAVTAAFLALGLFLLLCCHEDSGSGSRPAKASRELSPEEMA